MIVDEFICPSCGLTHILDENGIDHLEWCAGWEINNIEIVKERLNNVGLLTQKVESPN